MTWLCTCIECTTDAADPVGAIDMPGEFGPSVGARNFIEVRNDRDNYNPFTIAYRARSLILRAWARDIIGEGC